MARDTWYRLDSVGKYYSSQAGSTAQTVFRFSATLIDDIDETILQHAVDKTVRIFPGFNVCLRSGMFWHYLEPAADPPEVHVENLPICFGLHVDAKSILFRVSYYRDRINLEVSHMVSDGRGTTNFLKALLYAYIQERYGVEGVPFDYDGSDQQKAEDGFDKYLVRDKSLAEGEGSGDPAPGGKQKVYRLSGWHDKADPTYLEYHLPTQKVRALSRSYGVSVTSLVISALMSAIRAEMPRRDMQREIRIGIPVDLRQAYESTTTKNFFGMAFVSYRPQSEESVQDIATHVHQQLKEATTLERLRPRLDRALAFEKNAFLRFAPLFVKDNILELADWLVEREMTTTVSNLGQISINERMAPYIRDINLLATTTGLSITLCSFEDDLSIGISTIYSNLDVMKRFCRFFSSQEITGHLNISKTSEEVAADLLEAKIEISVKRLSNQIPTSEKGQDKGQKQPKTKRERT